VAVVNNSSKLVINTYSSEEVFEKAKEQGMVQDNEIHLIEGEEMEALSNADLEEILRNL
jgi:hypothetical protein